jgi:hypothetical protein
VKKYKFDLMDDHGKVASVTCTEEDYKTILANHKEEPGRLRIENIKIEEAS